MGTINTTIKAYFKNNKIKFKDISDQLNMSQSNLSERLNSNRSITLDEFFILYKNYGDGFAMAVMQHYNSRMLFLERIKQLIKITDDLKGIHEQVKNKNEEVVEILEEIDFGINTFSKQ